MISNIVCDGLREYACNDCKITAKFTSYKNARAARWAIARNYKDCYCPNCAPKYRNVGCYGYQREYRTSNG